MKQNPFEQYLRAAEPDKAYKSYAWNTAIGLQAVDDLKPSDFLYATAVQNIEGEITFEQVRALVRANYRNVSLGIYETTEYIEVFLRNLLLGEHNELLSRYLRIQAPLYFKNPDIQTQNPDIETILAGKIDGMSASTVSYIHLMYNRFGFQEVFGRSVLMDLLGLKTTATSDFISKLL